MRKKWILLSATYALLMPLVASAVEKPKNIIFIIADGMGSAYTTAYRGYMDNPATIKVETTVFDHLLVGMASTHSRGTQKNHTDNTYVTDSAASATALSTGVKTYNQAVAVDINDQPLQTIMEYAKSLGKKTGLVVTSQINHATPASFVAHNTYRYNYNAIADDYYDNRVNGQFVADLMFGGGKKYFIRKDRDIVSQFKQSGYHYADQWDQLDRIKQLPVLGLFAKKGIGYAIDNQVKHQPAYRLHKMVKKAMSLLQGSDKSSDKGYFLLIEASMIDWCGHANDIACAMHEVNDLARVVSYVKEQIDNGDDTLMVMTADHNTGGLSVGTVGEYRWKPSAVKQIRHSIDKTIDDVLKNKDMETLWRKNMAISISSAKLARLDKVQKQAIKLIDKAKGSDSETRKTAQDNAEQLISDELVALTSQLTLTGWTSSNHTGGDVQVFAHGTGKERFNGHLDNTDIGKQLFKLTKQ
ncbi:MAG: alkaline phosphatase [Alteromonadaceae bacterium]|jgi:alkaline phosphatase